MISFVIPAFNEARSIRHCVGSVREHLPASLEREIIVVDTGSDDGTADAARAAGARVVDSDAETVAGVRNDGVREARGRVLAFLDADCTITREWGEAVSAALAELEATPLACVGSQVVPPATDPVFLWTYWFGPFASQATASHIGSANMLCTRETFDTIGGFDRTLSSAEDYDFCRRIQAHGGVIRNRPALRAEHAGFPRTWGAFFRRERWHGAGDSGSLRAILGSTVALASLAFAGLIAVSLVFLVGGALPEAGLSLAAAVALVLAASVRKLGHTGLRGVLMGAVILPVYLAARLLAVWDALRGVRTRRPPAGRDHDADPA